MTLAIVGKEPLDELKLGWQRDLMGTMVG